MYPGRVLLEYKRCEDSRLVEQGSAFHYSDSLKIPKSKLPWGRKESTRAVSRVLLHGTVKTFVKDGKYRIGSYVHGDQVSIKYFDSNGNEISPDAFGANNFRGLIDLEAGSRWFYGFSQGDK